MKSSGLHQAQNKRSERPPPLAQGCTLLTDPLPRTRPPGLQYQFTGGRYKDDYAAREACDDAPSPVPPSPTTAPTKASTTPNPVPVATPAPTGPNAVYLGCFKDQKGARTMSGGYTDKENLTNEVHRQEDGENEIRPEGLYCTNLLPVSFSHRLTHDYSATSIKSYSTTSQFEVLPLTLLP